MWGPHRQYTLVAAPSPLSKQRHRSPPGSRHHRKASPLCLSHGWGTPVPFVCCLVVTRSRGRHLRDRQKLLWVFYFSLKWKRFGDRKRRLPLLVSPPRDWKPRELFICPRDVCVWWKEQVQRSLVYISFPLGLWMQAKRSDKEVENSRHCPGCLYRAFLESLWQILKQISSNIFHCYCSSDVRRILKYWS